MGSGIAGKALNLARNPRVQTDFNRRLAGTVPAGQPVGITRPVREAGKLMVGFENPNWQIEGSGTPTLTRGYTGLDASGNRTGIMSRTGAMSMLKVNPGTTGDEQIRLQQTVANLRTATLAGRLMLAVYIDVLPGYGAGEAGPSAALYVELNTNTGSPLNYSNALHVEFTANQIREGWNFLKFVQRAPLAYQAGSGVREDHPFGVVPTGYGTGADTDIVNGAITSIKIGWRGFPSTTSLYFDSIWTGFDSQAQIVFGADAAGQDLIDTIPVCAKYGFVGYTACPIRIWSSGDLVVTDYTQSFAAVRRMYEAGWDNINHTTNHRAMGPITSPAELLYEVEGVRGLYHARGLVRGANFYASPQSSTSRLSEKIIRENGFALQRHARKANVSVTPWGVDNIHHLGSSDLGHATQTGLSTVTSRLSGNDAGWQKFSQIKRMTDVIVAYGDTWFPFWHGITSLGDTGSGEDLTGDNLLITRSAITKTIEYWGQLDTAGALRVCDGMTGFYYGSGR